MLINRTPAAVETYNDIDSEVTNFFACLRDDGEELVRQISLTPFSREELVLAYRNERGSFADGTRTQILCSRASDANRIGANEQ